MQDKNVVTDINETINLIETYKLSALVWRFEGLPFARD